MSVSSLRILGLIIVSASLAVGCSSGRKIDVGGACILNTDCNQPLVCTMDKCHDACHGSADCPAGETCVKTDQGTFCQLPAEADCSRTTCGGAFACASDLQCRTTCQSAADCAEKQVCVSGVCADTTDLTNGQLPQKARDGGAGVAVGGACVLNSDCSSSLVCAMGKCHDACHILMDCPAGQSCVKTPDAVICQLPAEADCSRTTCGGALVCASDLRCRTGCQSAAGCTTGQVCVSGVCADPSDLDANGQLPQKGPSASSDGGADVRASDAGGKDGGADLAVGPSDAPNGTGADVAGTGTRADVSVDLAASKLPDAGADLVAQVDLPADLAADKLASTGPDLNPGTPDAAIGPYGGGASPVPTGCGVTPTSTRYFCDDFESGLGKWVVSGQDWDTTDSTYRSPGHSVTDSPGGNYVAGANAAIVMAASVDLTAAVSPVLTFWNKFALACSPESTAFGCSTGWSNSDFIYVEASSDGGTTWSQLVAMTSLSNVTTWALQQFSLGAYSGKKVKVRFRLVDNKDGFEADGWYIDDVEIRELPPPDSAGATGCSAMPAATTIRYFCDDFESGLSKWNVSGQDWNTTFSNARSGTHSVTDSPDGSIVAGGNVSITMASSAALTGAVSPVLVFWDRLAASANYSYVEASSDGGTTWSELTHWQNADHSTWLLQQLSLAKFVGKNVMIRFRLAQSAGNTGDGWYIDDVEISESN